MQQWSLLVEEMVGGVSPVPLALLLIGLSVVITGVAKSGFGGGIGILSVPLMVNAMPAHHALGVMLPVLMAADVFAVWQHRRHCDSRLLRGTLAGGVLGVVVGLLVLMWLSRSGDAASSGRSLNVALQWSVGVLSIGMVAIQLYRWAGGRLPRVPGTWGWSLGFGWLSGVTSTLAHAAGPVMSVYLLEQRLERRVLVGTMVMFFFVLNIVKVPVYVHQGLIDAGTLQFSAMLLPLVPVGSLLGFWMLRRIAERPFVLVMYAAAAAAGARAIWQVW